MQSQMQIKVIPQDSLSLIVLVVSHVPATQFSYR